MKLMKTSKHINIKLEPLTYKDKNSVFDLFTNEKVLQSYSKKPIPTREHSDDFIQKVSTNGHWTWKITRHEEINGFLGICSYHHYNQENKSIEIGGTLFPKFWGKGIMLCAFRQLIEQAREVFNIKQVIRKTQSSNKNAIWMVEKLGFNKTITINNETTLVKYLD